MDNVTDLETHKVKKQIHDMASAAIAFDKSDPLAQLLYVRKHVFDMYILHDGEWHVSGDLLSALDNGIKEIEMLRGP